MKDDRRIYRALELIRIGAYFGAKKELISAYCDASLYGSRFARMRLLAAIEYLTWKAESEDHSLRNEVVWREVYRLLMDEENELR